MVNNDNFLLKEIPSENIYYVYGYYLEDDTPFYIGMGKKDRINRHKKLCFINGRHYDYPFYRKLRKLYDNNTSFYCSKIRDNMSRKDAQNLEISLISELGRKFNGGGVLYNLTSGGEGGNGGLSNMKKVAIYDCNTLKLYKVFNSVNDCAKFLNIKSTGNLSEAASLKTKLRKYYIMYYETEPDLIFKPKDSRTHESMSKKIISKNVITNEVKLFISSRTCCDYYKLHKQTLRDKILNKLIYKNTYMFSYGE